MYKLNSQIPSPTGLKDADTVLRLADNAHIPMNPDNTDYQAYLKWVAEGNTPLPAENN